MQILDAEPIHSDELKAVHVEAWSRAYRGLLPKDYYSRRLTDHRRRNWVDLISRQRAAGGGVVVAMGDGHLCAFCQFGPTEDEDDDPRAVGQIHRLFVHPEHQRTGLGRALLAAATARLRNGGLSAVTLWALKRDLSARAFYEPLGWIGDGAQRTDEPGVVDIRYRKVTPAAPSGFGT